MLLILSGILSLIVAFANPSLNTTAPDIHCVIRNLYCDPNLTHPCCDQKDICKQIEPNSFKCIERVGLGKFCELDQDCKKIRHSKCSKENTCICRINNIEVNETTCAPVLGKFCWENEPCATDNAVCINNECQCNVSNYQRFNDQCIFNTLGAPCESDKSCERVRFAICSEHKICSCSANTFALNQDHCAPLIGGFCWTTYDCLVPNSICVDYTCQCEDFYVSQSTNQCVLDKILAQLGTNCKDSNDCIDILNSECSVRKKCECMSNYAEYNMTVCRPLLGSYCSKSQECATINSICSNNICECGNGLIEFSNNKCTSHFIGKHCMINEDCEKILGSKCVNNNCTCKDNYAMVNTTACAPLLGEYCKSSQQCAPDNSICYNSKCQCDSNYVRQFNNICIPKAGRLNTSCDRDDDCVHIKYAVCSADQKCFCRSNYVALGDHKCIALIDEYCDSDEECISYNTVCIHNKCQCAKTFVMTTKYQCDHILLGSTCHKDDNCDVRIKNSVCSIDNTCVCRENYYALNRFECVPFLNGYCLNNDECRFNHSVCVENKCQCKHNFQFVSETQCKPIDYLYECNEDLDCGDPWHIKCFSDKKCRCNPNNFIINRSTCVPLLRGYCWRDSQCIVTNSVCIDYQCKCKSNFMAVSGNLCLPV
ncbi:prion-like-(Q/N-rich) domain-bearing protein 25 [Microplitis mediator]|uniref:prion-like-(Q/N-rich) domain-bearing protein 25 n=1 Tax=Microplitis mediator TaxID=375433 RepID=UPI00255622D2|nr:prion-like-(Q/N-rich) domain-bearing protein 25 [Microplitis mediator]